jgi:superfamily II DNA or RNA helicase
MKASARRAAETSLRVPDTDERLILATGRYLGEGFDDPRLDTLFISMPIAWKGTLAQYVGRLHREHAHKHNVIVYDYVDADVPVLARMAKKREAGYRAMGYRVRSVNYAAISRTTESAAPMTYGDSRRPSEITDQYWIYAERSDLEHYPEHSERGGKWMLFIKSSDIDVWWAKIKSATESGLRAAAPKLQR